MRINIQFLQTGGVPLTNDLMDVLQEAYTIFNVLGDVAGHLTILSGCTLTGQSVSPGIVVINGDVLYFEGGLVNTSVYIHTAQITKTFQDQTDKILIEKKTVKFGLSAPGNMWNWGDFKRLDTLKVMMEKISAAATQADLNDIKTRLDKVELKTAPIVNGGIAWFWRKPLSEIPAGWKPCTDFKGKTIFGLDPNDPVFSTLGTTVGSHSKTITQNNIPDYVIPFYGATNSGQTAVGNDLSVIKWNGKAPDGFYDHTYGINSGGKGMPMDVLNRGVIVDFIEPDFQ